MRPIIALLLTATAAHSAPCGAYDAIAQALARQYGEAVQSQGYSEDGRLLQLWANPASKTWTITLTDKAGVACVMSAGKDYTALPQGEPL